MDCTLKSFLRHGLIQADSQYNFAFSGDPRLRQPSQEEQELKHMLELLRIKAATHVLNWVQRTGPPGIAIVHK